MTRRTDLPVAEGDLDADLVRSVKIASIMRQGFYVVVLLVALAGQVSGAVETLKLPLIWAIPAVGALELGGIVVLANADVRRRLGERAIASRLLSVLIAAWAVAFNWMAHADHLLGGFFAGMSALGYLVWLMHTENQRRDRLRAKSDLPPTTPAYELFSHWLRHPLLTIRAKSLAKANPSLGLYTSLAAAREEVRRERRTSAISKVLHRKIRAAVDPTTADIAVAVYDLDEIAVRLADTADYTGLTALIAADLAPARLAANSADAPAVPLVAVAGTPEESVLEESPVPEIEAAVELPPVPVSVPAPVSVEQSVVPLAAGATSEGLTLSEDQRRELERMFNYSRQQAQAATVDLAAVVPTPVVPDPVVPAPRSRGRASAVKAAAQVIQQAAPQPALRTRVHAALNENVGPGDSRDIAHLAQLVDRALNLNESDQVAAFSFITSWRDADRASRAGV